MECESETGKTKISDSAYSNSFYKSNSHGSASSKSLLSGSNCSSGYGGIVKEGSLQVNKRNKDKDHKKNKSQSTNMPQNHVVPSGSTTVTNCVSSEQDNLRLVTELFSKTDIDVVSTESKENCIDTILDSSVKQTEHASNEDPIESINTTEPKNGFCCVISMYDGIVLFTSPSLTPLLGFPKNMWLGRLFSDFLHPKDRDTFCNQITNGIAIPLIEGASRKRDVSSSCYVCLRKYRGLKASGYRVVEKPVSYQAFHLSVTLKYPAENVNSICSNNRRDSCLIILAVPVYSNYAVPDEVKKSNIFGMRHTAECIFSQVDADVVMNFGYLPQEMLGKSVFDFYHPEDMPFLKEVYESIMVKCQITGSVYRSKPYRFAVKNGDFVMLETEWSCFINPLSRRLEFVMGLHRVLQGPSNPDIFETPKDNKNILTTDEVLKEAKIIREEIVYILNKEFSRPSKLPKQDVTKRCKNLAAFMENVIEEVSKPNLPSNSIRKDSIVPNGVNGHIEQSSPQNDDYDRESSSETPPSYTQLNYNDNINRFFKSKPMTNASDESEPTAQVAIDLDQELKSSSADPRCNHRVSGSGSTGNFSSGSNPNIESGNTSATNTSNCSYEPLLLTEELILRHNEDMEKMMRQRHKELRSSMKVLKESKRPFDKNEKIVDNGCNDKYDHQKNGQLQGIKRSGSLSWEQDNYKVLKHKHLVNEKQNEARNPCNNNCTSKFAGECHGINHNGTEQDNIPGINDLPLWPPFSVTMGPLNGNQSFAANSVTNAPGMFPVYYIPTQGKSSVDYTETYSSPNYQVQYMRGMMYNPVFPTSPIFCSPMAMVPFSVPQPVAPLINEIKHTSRPLPSDFKENSPRGLPSQFQRPASQATSVKAEPGSAIGSIASASCVNRELSEFSPKDLGLPSVCSPDSPLVSSIDGEGHLENSNVTSKTAETVEDKFVVSTPHDEESSYSSFYSSFFKTDTGSGSNDDSTGENNRKTKNNIANEILRRSHPARKYDPAWMQAVNVTPELIYRYQITTKSLEDVLEADLKTLENVKQPDSVNEQLEQLYLSIEVEKISPNINLNEPVSSSNSDDEYIHNFSNKLEQKRMSYSTLMMIYEEDAPLPSPDL